MRIKNIVVLFVLCIGCRLTAQNVIKVDCYQEGNDIAVTYFLDRDASTEVFYSKDGGRTFIGPLKKVSGNIGENAQKGQNKLLWSVLDEVESLQGDNIVFKVSISNPFGIEMVFVEGGIFTMGSTRNPSELPVHYVQVSDFFIGKHEVTQKLWYEIMKYNPSYHKGDNYPVENVSMEEILLFLKKLSKKTGNNYRLPTEAEWEYAARGGNKSMGYIYPGAKYGPQSIACHNTFKTSEVGHYNPNELGLFDMAGNVWEICTDDYTEYKNNNYQDRDINPIYQRYGSTKGQFKVMRGGSYKSKSDKCTVTIREMMAAYYKDIDRGFRLVLEIE